MDEGVKEKIYAGIIILVLVVGGVFVGYYAWQKYHGPEAQPLPVVEPINESVGFGKFAPRLDAGWTLTKHWKNLADWPAYDRDRFMRAGVYDAAAWEFRKENQVIGAVVKQYDSVSAYLRGNKDFTSLLSWPKRTETAFGIVGVFRDEGNPLMIYIPINDIKTIYYAYYFNNGTKYSFGGDDAIRQADQKWLIDLTKPVRDMYPNITANIDISSSLKSG
jgi:hypothetical protein